MIRSHPETLVWSWRWTTLRYEEVLVVKLIGGPVLLDTLKQRNRGEEEGCCCNSDLLHGSPSHRRPPNTSSSSVNSSQGHRRHAPARLVGAGKVDVLCEGPRCVSEPWTNYSHIKPADQWWVLVSAERKRKNRTHWASRPELVLVLVLEYSRIFRGQDVSKSGS